MTGGAGRASKRSHAFPTPTPPPVTVTLAADGSALDDGVESRRNRPAKSPKARLASEPARSAARSSRWRWLLPVALLGLAALLALLGWRSAHHGKHAWLTSGGLMALGSDALDGAASSVSAAPSTASTAEPVAPPPELPKIQHQGHVPIHGGVLVAPSTFVPAPDGSYDLIVHFHGDVGVVRESVEVAGINAIVAIVNLGIGSKVYRETYDGDGEWERLLDNINRGVINRGVPSPKVRRIALSCWSAGYGAVGSVLLHRRGTDPLDAILVEDGIHAGWREEDPSQLNPLPFSMFVDAARAAAGGKILFTMTHSEISPPLYGGTSTTAAFMLHAVGAEPVKNAMLELPPHVKLVAAEHAVSKRLEKHMVPISDTRVGLLHIRGYAGDTREHHMAHLLQMAATVLPELQERWAKPSTPLLGKLGS